MNEMLNFVEFNPVSNMRAYGLGVQEFRKNLSFGERAIGHGGANIGTTTYMVYLPDHHVSIVVMINAFPNDGAEEITKGLEKVILGDLGAYGISSLIKAYPLYFVIIILAIAYWTIFIVFIIRKKRKLRSDTNDNQKAVD